MKKKTKICLFIMCIMIVVCFLYGTFVWKDSERLKVSEFNTKPNVTLFEVETEDEITYIGLGYSVTYSEPKEEFEENGVTYIVVSGKSVEFKWFGITIWGWWE